MIDIGILGGGISGLSLASFLTRRAEVLESEARPGGLARSFETNGFRSDIGGHIMFSKDKEVLDLMVATLGDNVERRRRANVIRYDGAYVKYPFENGLGALPNKQDIFECVAGFVDAWHLARTPEGRARPAPANLKEWCYRMFGAGITEKYLLPYNDKIWKRPAEQIGTDWVDRVPQPPLEDVLKSAIGLETEGYLHQLFFFYPKRGGIESLVRGFIARCEQRGQTIRTGFRVRNLRRTNTGWVVSDGREEREYRQLVSTMPILPLLETLDEVPSAVMEAARALAYNSLRVVLLGVARPNMDEFTAIYVPDRRSVYHRVCYNNAFSPENAPAGASSISVEITCSEKDAVGRMDDASLIERVIEDLGRDGIVGRHEIVATTVRRERYAYVVYDHGHSSRVGIVRDYLTSRGIHMAGRFAEYRYVNIDACIRRALDLAGQLNAEPS